MDISIKIGGLTGPLGAPRAGFFRALAYDWDGIETALATSSTGTSSGAAHHKPLRVTRAIDAASPQLANGFFSNAALGGTEGVIVAADYLNSAGVAQAATFTLKTPHAVKLVFSAHAGGADDVTEEMSFVYQQIAIRQDPTGATATANFG